MFLVRKFSNRLPNLVHFAYISMEGDNERMKRYLIGMKKAYEKEQIQRIHNNKPIFDTRSKNIFRGLDYIDSMQNVPRGISDYDYLLPLTTDINGKRVTVGVRNLAGDITPETGIASIDGLTVTHPKYKNVGADALIQTMINHANDTQDTMIHNIEGSTPALARLYRQKATKYTLPRNLRIRKF